MFSFREGRIYVDNVFSTRIIMKTVGIEVMIVIFVVHVMPVLRMMMEVLVVMVVVGI